MKFLLGNRNQFLAYGHRWFIDLRCISEEWHQPRQSLITAGNAASASTFQSFQECLRALPGNACESYLCQWAFQCVTKVIYEQIQGLAVWFNFSNNVIVDCISGKVVDTCPLECVINVWKGEGSLIDDNNRIRTEILTAVKCARTQKIIYVMK